MPLTQLQTTNQAFPPGEPDVQRTSFSLDVLGRFICSTWEEASVNPDFDVIIIGGGMYGLLLRREDLQRERTARPHAPACAGARSRTVPGSRARPEHP